MYVSPHLPINPPQLVVFENSKSASIWMYVFFFLEVFIYCQASSFIVRKLVSGHLKTLICWEKSGMKQHNVLYASPPFTNCVWAYQWQGIRRIWCVTASWSACEDEMRWYMLNTKNSAGQIVLINGSKFIILLLFNKLPLSLHTLFGTIHQGQTYFSNDIMLIIL